MELFAGLLGAIGGAVVTFALSAWQKRRQSRRKSVAAIRGEFRVARGLADDVLEANRSFMESDHQKPGWSWCEVTLFPTAAWSAVIGSGGIDELSNEAIEAASEAHAAIVRANFVARQIQLGRFDPKKARRYNELVIDVSDNLAAALNEIRPQ